MMLSSPLRPELVSGKIRWAAIFALCFVLRLAADDAITPPEQLKGLSLEQLLDVKVISASRFLEDWKTAPAALGVITSDEIERSGAVRLAPALRLATGLDVARFTASSYAISARGFNATSSNKLQVMLDGRSLYTPLFSGVFWEVQDTMLEDLDRIEVVRGPGATLWGTNAMNGVINIVSKNARDTQGALVTAGGGNEEKAFGSVRYGGRLGDETFYRVYFKYVERDDLVFSDGTPALDGMMQSQGGFRMDSTLAGENTLTVQGDLYCNRFGIAARPDAENDGGNLLTRWTHPFSADSDLQIQTYYDWGLRDVPLQFREDRRTWDFDVQQHFKVGDHHDIVLGGNYHTSADKTGQVGRTFTFVPPDRRSVSTGGFVQDQIALMPSKLTLYAGSKIERNEFTGWELQPNLRLAYAPTKRQFVWAAVSRAVRAPTRADSDSRFSPTPGTGFVLIEGNPAFRAETLLAYEAGYRVQVGEQVFADLSLFRNEYDYLRTLEPQPPLGVPLLVSNEREGNTCGGELALTFQATPWWRLTGSYSYLRENLRFKAGSHDPTNGTLEGNDPSHLASLRSAFELPRGIELDAMLRYVSARPNPRVPAYLALDVRLAFPIWRNGEVALVGRNLLDPQHPEFAGTPQPEVQRSVFGQVAFRF